MKKKKIIFYSLMFLPLIVVLIALHFLPERIPAHYDFNNQVTRWGINFPCDHSFIWLLYAWYG